MESGLPALLGYVPAQFRASAEEPSPAIRLFPDPRDKILKAIPSSYEGCWCRTSVEEGTVLQA